LTVIFLGPTLITTFWSGCSKRPQADRARAIAARVQEKVLKTVNTDQNHSDRNRESLILQVNLSE
jgi:hypothetical protein